MICLPGWLESGERDFTLSDWLKIGCRAGQGRRQVGLGTARGCPEEVRLAVTAGILSAGADCWQYGALSLPEFRCCIGASAPSLALMLLPPRSARVAEASGDVLFPLKRAGARGRENASGRNLSMEALKSLYPLKLLRMGSAVAGKEARFTGGGPSGRILEEVFCQLGGSIGGEVTVQLWGEDGRLSFFHGQTLLWDGTAPDGDGPALALRMLDGFFRNGDVFLAEHESIQASVCE